LHWLFTDEEKHWSTSDQAEVCQNVKNSPVVEDRDLVPDR
jgi:hypothetical protein